MIGPLLHLPVNTNFKLVILTTIILVKASRLQGITQSGQGNCTDSNRLKFVFTGQAYS